LGSACVIVITNGRGYGAEFACDVVRLSLNYRSLFFRFTGTTETVKRTGFLKTLIWTLEPDRNNVHALNENCLNWKPVRASFNCEHVGLRAFHTSVIPEWNNTAFDKTEEDKNCICLPICILKLETHNL